MLFAAYDAKKITKTQLEEEQNAAVADNIKRFEATGSPIMSLNDPLRTRNRTGDDLVKDRHRLNAAESRRGSTPGARQTCPLM
jgi:hypothetical protein